MITLSLNFDKASKNTNRGTQEQQIRDIVDTHLAFPGSEKLKMGVTIKENGASSVSFTGPAEAIAEAKRLWRENVLPAASKVKRAATRATKSVKKTAAKKVKPKVATAKKAAKHAVTRAKTKVSGKTSKKRKS